MLFYYPNRPMLIPPNQAYLNSLESSGKFIAEQKWNGDNIQFNTDFPKEFWNRSKERHRFIPDEALINDILKLPKHSIFNAELMNYRTKETKGIIIIHCIMSYKGKPLIGKTWGDSRNILEDCSKGDYARISEIHKSGFWNLFQQADGQKIEGIILKQPAGKLVFSTTPIQDVHWMLKIRKPCKKYQF